MVLNPAALKRLSLLAREGGSSVRVAREVRDKYGFMGSGFKGF